MQQKPDRVAIGVAGCFLAFLVVFAGISAGLFLWLRPHPPSPGGRPAAAAGTAAATVTGSEPIPVAPAEPPALPASSPTPTASAAPAEPSGEPRPGLTGWGASPSGTTGGTQAGPPSGTTANNPSPGGARSAAPGPKDTTEAGGCTLNLNSVPPSAVSLDGRPIGSTPAMGVGASCGPHSVTFVHAERGKKTISIALTAGKPGSVGVKF